MKIDKLLKELDACIEARIWAKDKDWQEIYETYPRGDWLLWLFQRTRIDNNETLRQLTLAEML